MEFITSPNDKKNKAPPPLSSMNQTTSKQLMAKQSAAKQEISKKNTKTSIVSPVSKSKKSKDYRKKNIPSDDEEESDEEDDDWVSDDEEEEEEEEEEEVIEKEKKDKKKDTFDEKKYTQLLSSLFPSKYMNEKVEKINKDERRRSSSLHSPMPLLTSPIPFPSKKTAKKYKKYIEEDEKEYAEECEEEADNYYKKDKKDKKDKKNLTNMLKNGSKFNIIFTLGDAGLGNGKKYKEEDDEEYDSEYDEEYDSEEDDEDDEDYDSEEEEEEDSEDEDEDEEEDSDEEEEEGESSDLDDNTSYEKMIEIISKLPEKEQSSSTIKKVLATLEKNKLKREKKQKLAIKKAKKKNTNSFKKLLREKNVMNDVRFFKDNMTQEQQEVVIKQLEEITKYSEVDKPYRLALIDSNIPVAYKTCALKKINNLRYMDPGAGEYYKIKNWVDTFMQIPFGKHKVLPLTINDGVEKCHEFMANAKSILDEAVYGLNDAKLQIMQMVGQWLVNPDAIGTAIAIKGPMGTGKTTLVKEGISKILGRDFAFIALGGATDSSFLEGHSYTYEGSSWGKIVDILIQCKSMNPVIYFDELDKVSETPKGEEIIGILTHLTDTSQNSKFHDKYFAGIDFDLSRCLFIFSYNDESKVNPILRDRMYRIHTKGYDLPQKTIISNQHLLPKIREQVAFKLGEITIPDETLHYMINNHTDKEDGVRNLKRCLEIIHTKLNLYRLMKPGTNLFEKDDNMALTVEFPITVTQTIVDKLIKKNSETGAWSGMYS